MKYNIIKQIVKYINEHDILYDYDSYEQMPVFHTFPELDCLSGFINKEYYVCFCVNMAIMYVNQGILYAQSHLSNEDYKNYMIYFKVCINKDEEDDFITTDVCFSRKANVHLSNIGSLTDVKVTKIYKIIKNSIGINEFSCYYLKNECGDEHYSFIPRRIDLD